MEAGDRPPPSGSNPAAARTVDNERRVPRMKPRSAQAKRRYRIRKELWKAQGKRCAYCHAPLRIHEATFDHVIPRAHGGTSRQSNLVIACWDCNRRKGAQLDWEA